MEEWPTEDIQLPDQFMEYINANPLKLKEVLGFLGQLEILSSSQCYCLTRGVITE